MLARQTKHAAGRDALACCIRWGGDFNLVSFEPLELGPLGLILLALLGGAEVRRMEDGGEVTAR